MKKKIDAVEIAVPKAKLVGGLINAAFLQMQEKTKNNI